jgi:hypothetical protein
MMLINRPRSYSLLILWECQAIEFSGAYALTLTGLFEFLGTKVKEQARLRRVACRGAGER